MYVWYLFWPSFLILRWYLIFAFRCQGKKHFSSPIKTRCRNENFNISCLRNVAVQEKSPKGKTQEEPKFPLCNISLINLKCNKNDIYSSRTDGKLIIDQIHTIQLWFSLRYLTHHLAVIYISTFYISRISHQYVPPGIVVFFS